jgi:hypothetical protein
VNNLNNEEIDEEITVLEEKIGTIEQTNFSYFKKIREKLTKLIDDNKQINNIQNNKKLKNKPKLISKVNLTDPKILEQRLKNLTNQIFTLEMKQFAESIFCIKKDLKKNEYILLFDPSENIETLVLDEQNYKKFFKYRDPLGSVSVYDLFQEKIHSY